jgi:hypothetical protein
MMMRFRVSLTNGFERHWYIDIDTMAETDVFVVNDKTTESQAVNHWHSVI